MAVMFQNAFKEKLKHAPQDQHTRLKTAWSQFQAQGLPTQKDPIWHYTPLSHFELDQFSLSLDPISENLTQLILQKHLIDLAEAIYLVFYNGQFASTLSSPLPSWITLKPHTMTGLDPLQLLNQIFSNQTLAIKNPKKPVYVIHLSHPETQKKSIMGHSACELVVTEKSEVIFIEQFISLSKSNQACFQNTSTHVSLEDTATLTYATLHEGSPTDCLLQDLRFSLNSDATLNAFLLPLNARLNHLYCHVQLKQPKATANLYGLGSGQDHQHIDTYLHVEHLAHHANSNSTFRGIFQDHATGAFTGKMQIHPNTPGSETHFQSKNILLSKTAKAYVRPQLEIDFDEVQCTHGATVGTLDPNALFYLQARGLDKKTAEKLLLKAFLTPITQPLTESKLCGILKKLETTFQF